MPFNDVVDPESLLSRFAYKSTEQRARSPPLLQATSRPRLNLNKDPQLARLSKCICCGLHWTSSKSAKQKRTHIDQCAKKNALTRETVRVLIERETTCVAPPKDVTLMDSVVPTSPVKKAKRQHVVSTVRSLPETRDTILDKARDIIGPTNSPADDPQPTQQFAQSALARRNAKRPASFDVDDHAEEPTCTQPFGASSLLRRTTCERPRPVSSMFAQDSIFSGDRHTRPASPPHLSNDSRTARRRRLR